MTNDNQKDLLKNKIKIDKNLKNYLQKKSICLIKMKKKY